MQFGDFFVKRGSTAPAATGEPSPAPKTDVQPVPPSSENALSDQQHDRMNLEALESEALKTREEQIEELLITDPLAAEEMMQQGELEDADESGDDE